MPLRRFFPAEQGRSFPVVSSARRSQFWNVWQRGPRWTLTVLSAYFSDRSSLFSATAESTDAEALVSKCGFGTISIS